MKLLVLALLLLGEVQAQDWYDISAGTNTSYSKNGSSIGLNTLMRFPSTILKGRINSVVIGTQDNKEYLEFDWEIETGGLWYLGIPVGVAVNYRNIFYPNEVNIQVGLGNPNLDIPFENVKVGGAAIYASMVSFDLSELFQNNDTFEYSKFTQVEGTEFDDFSSTRFSNSTEVKDFISRNQNLFKTERSEISLRSILKDFKELSQTDGFSGAVLKYNFNQFGKNNDFQVFSKIGFNFIKIVPSDEFSFKKEEREEPIDLFESQKVYTYSNIEYNEIKDTEVTYSRLNLGVRLGKIIGKKQKTRIWIDAETNFNKLKIMYQGDETKYGKNQFYIGVGGSYIFYREY